jgi:hypothetical protein
MRRAARGADLLGPLPKLRLGPHEIVVRPEQRLLLRVEVGPLLVVGLEPLAELVDRLGALRPAFVSRPAFCLIDGLRM